MWHRPSIGSPPHFIPNKDEALREPASSKAGGGWLKREGRRRSRRDRGRVRGSGRGRQTVVWVLAQLRQSKAQHPPQTRLLLLFLICCCCSFLGARFAAHPPSKTNRDRRAIEGELEGREVRGSFDDLFSSCF